MGLLPGIGRTLAAVLIALTLSGAPAVAQGDSMSMIERDLRSFSYKNEKAESVSLVGDFNGWNERSHRMQRLSDGVWQVDVALRKGKVYEYAFLVDGKLMLDPENKIQTTDGKLSVISVGERTEIFIGDASARVEGMQLSLNRLVEQIAFLSKQVENLHESLRAEHDLVLKKEAQVDMVRTELESARMEKVGSARDLVTKEAKLADLTEKYNSVRLDLQEKTALLDSQTQRITTMQKSVDDFQTKYNQTLQETRELREKSKEAVAQCSTLEQEIGQLRSRNKSLEKDLKEKQNSLDILTGRSSGSSSRTVDPSEGTSTPSGTGTDEPKDPGTTDPGTGTSETPAANQFGGSTSTGIFGNVLAVSDKMNLLFISVGEENGVTEGQEMFVYRGEELIARVRVKKTYKDQAEAVVGEGADWKLIHNGDSVLDRLRIPGPDDGAGSGKDDGAGSRATPDGTEGTTTPPDGTGGTPTETPTEDSGTQRPPDPRRGR